LDGSSSAALFLDPSQGVSVVQDLTDPILIEPGLAPHRAILAPDLDGGLLLVTEEAGTFRVFSGEGLDDEIGTWSGGTTSTSYFDFRAIDGEMGTAGVLLVGGSETYLAKIDDSTAAPRASLERGGSTCDSLTIGITCDACPDGTLCETWTHLIKRGALIERHGRLYAAYVAAEERSQRQMTRHTNITGIGCTCNPDEVSSDITGTYLVVKEVLHQEGTVVRMRTRLPDDWKAEHLQFVRDSTGNLDVVVGPSLFSYSGPLHTFPVEPEIYRVLHIAAPD